MITYIYSESPFFTANQNYCDKVKDNLESAGIEFTGQCDSYGYEIVAKFYKSNKRYQLRCYKYQVTRDGVIIPNNAAEYIGIEINATGLNNNISIQYGRNRLRRLFMESGLKAKIKFPFYLKTNHTFNEAQIQKLIDFFSYYKIISWRLKYGKLEIKIFSAFTKPVSIIDSMEKDLAFLF